MELKGHTIGFKGEYSATVLKADGTVKEFLNEEKTLRSGDVIKNLLLDNFFERLISMQDPTFRNFSIRCGTGTNPVTTSQTILTSQMNLISGNWPSSPRTPQNTIIDNGVLKASETYTFTFSLGQIVGNISELGLNLANVTTGNPTTIQSRALVVDSLGNPTTISVTASEQLILTYTLRMETSASDVVTTVDMLINGVPTSVEVTQRWHRLALGVDSYTISSMGGNDAWFATNGLLMGVNESPTGSSALIGSPGNYVFNDSGGKSTNIAASTSQGNLSGGISVICGSTSLGSAGVVKFGFNPPLPKNSDRTMSITIRQTFGRLP